MRERERKLVTPLFLVVRVEDNQRASWAWERAERTNLK